MLKRLLAAAIAATSIIAAAPPSMAATIDLGFALDESGSVRRSDFGRAKRGLADALAQIPTSGDDVYRISIVSFASRARTIVPVTVVTQTTLATIQQTVRDISQVGTATAIGSAIQLLTNNFLETGLGDATLFNVTTDGESNRGSITPADAALAAAAAGVDGLSFEAVGAEVNEQALLDIAFPGTPVLIDDVADLTNPFEQSFVLQVTDFTEFQSAIEAKVSNIINNSGGPGDAPSPVPLPAGMPLILIGLGAFGGLRAMQRKAA